MIGLKSEVDLAKHLQKAYRSHYNVEPFVIKYLDYFIIVSGRDKIKPSEITILEGETEHAPQLKRVNLGMLELEFS